MRRHDSFKRNESSANNQFVTMPARHKHTWTMLSPSSTIHEPFSPPATESVVPKVHHGLAQSRSRQISLNSWASVPVLATVSSLVSSRKLSKL